ncbi:putative plant non-specific lipid-transfer protein/Par allergen [Helianthus annuus]|nr:putative plant non-specific lipid-transfer protein/Par allergen [Helianthus annuus]KAJ0691542.1 putative plant non-specific lipid-transfer protein/Par allergen [Helianthus annuus]
MTGMMMKVLCIIVVCMLVVAPYAEAVSCSDVVNKLSPCISYLKNGGSVSAACCNGIKGLNAAAKSTADKKTACGCLKNAYQSISGINADNASGLPKRCGVNIPYKISMSTNCNKYVKFTHFISLITCLSLKLIIITS